MDTELLSFEKMRQDQMLRIEAVRIANDQMMKAQADSLVKYAEEVYKFLKGS